MRITRIDKSEILKRLEVKFNPPSLLEGFSERQFRTEWHDARDALKEILDRFGEGNAYGEGDYFLDDSTSSSRGIGVEVTNPAFLTDRVVDEVQTFLRSLAEAFEVHFAVSPKGLISDVLVGRNEVVASEVGIIRSSEGDSPSIVDKP